MMTWLNQERNMTRSRILLTFLIVSIPVAIAWVAIVCAVLCFGGRHSVLRTLEEHEIRPMFSRLTGRELPGEVNDLRAITFGEGGMKELYVACQVDRDDYLRVLEELSGEGVEKYEFPRETNNPLGWPHAFDRAREFEQKLGVTLFDKSLYRRVATDYLDRLSKGYSEGAITGHCLQFHAETKREVFHYFVLMFEDQRVIYISAGRRPKGFHPP